MPQSIKRWTVEEVLDLPDDGNRYELVDGELLVTPAPTESHQALVLEFATRFHSYLRAHPIGGVLIAPIDLRVGSSLVQPDIHVRPRKDSDDRRPLLVVEVLSPSTEQYDRFVKRLLYQREGIPEYWIVDLDTRAVERWRGEDERAELIERRIEWLPDGVSEPLVIDLEDVFGYVMEG